MTAQEAADKLLRELGQPTSARDLASIALERGLVRSWSRTPTLSIAQTIEKNIRQEAEPRLGFVKTSQGRLVGLPQWHTNGLKPEETVQLRVSIPTGLMEQLRLARQARIGADLNTTVRAVLSSGLAALKPAIQESLLGQMERLEGAPKEAGHVG